MKLIGITGGAGFIGGHVVDRLLELGYNEPLILDHKGRTLSNSITMLGDVRDATVVAEFAAHVDGIIHLAGVLGTQETIANPWPAAETNILGMINILNACRQYELPNVNIGIGNFQMINTYSTTKLAAEKLLYQYRDNFNLRGITVRPMNAYGPRQRVAPPFGPGKVRKIIPSFICRALSNMPIEIYGNGEQISDMVWVGDVAHILVQALEKADQNIIPNHPVEIGPSESKSVSEVAQLVLDKVVERGYPYNPIKFLPMRPGELESGELSIEDVDKVIDFLRHLGVNDRLIHQVVRPLSNRVNADYKSLEAIDISHDSLLPLEDGLDVTIDWYENNRGETWDMPA